MVFGIVFTVEDATLGARPDGIILKANTNIRKNYISAYNT